MRYLKCLLISSCLCLSLSEPAHGTGARHSLLDEKWIENGSNPMGGQGAEGDENSIVTYVENVIDSIFNIFGVETMSSQEFEDWYSDPKNSADRIWRDMARNDALSGLGITPFTGSDVRLEWENNRYEAFSGQSDGGLFSGLVDFLKIGEIAEGVGWLFTEAGGAISDPVNVVNGVFYQHEVDLQLAAPTPLVITRSYLSSSWAISDMGAAWRMNHDYFLFVNEPVYELGSGLDLPDTAEVRLGEVDGTMLVYSRTASAPPNRLYVNGNPNASAVVEGINNYNSNGVGARSNLRNNYVEYDPGLGRFSVHSADGTVRIFEWKSYPVGADESHEDYRHRPYLEEEQKADGTSFVYEYDDTLGLPDYIKVMDATKSIIYNWVKFEYSPQKRISSLIASDGRRVSYSYDDYNDLVRVVRADHSEVSFEYDHIRNDQGLFLSSTHRIVRVDKPSGRSLVNEYYEEGDLVDGEILGEADYRVGHVKLQKAPVLGHVQPVANARFKYFEEADGSGRTEVFDILGNKLVYRYNSRKLLTDIEKYTKQGEATGEPLMNLDAFTYTLYSAEKRYWQSGGTGNLIAKAMLDGDRNVVSYYSMTYDGSGNLMTRTEWGNLSGDCEIIPVLDSAGNITNPEEVESATTTYTYGVFNLPTSSTSPNGLVSRSVYEPATGNLLATYVCEPDETPEDPFDNPIYSRAFFAYNANNVVTETISDNGTVLDKADLTDVTQRSKVEYIPGTSLPAHGLPETVISSYWNGSTWKMRNKKVITYNHQGWPAVEKVYDGNDAFQYQTTKAFDAMGRVLSSTDPLGNPIEYRYDANGNLVWTDGPRHYTDIQDYVEIEYDFFNRPVKTTRDIEAGAQVTKSVGYDGFGNEISRTDTFGNTTEMFYDDLHRLVKTVLPEVRDADGNAYHPEATIGYDILGRTVAMTNANGAVGSIAYNSRGQKIREDLPDGTWVEYRYNLDGTLARQIASTGNYTEYAYDLLGRVTDTLNYNSNGILLSSTSATYDAFHQTSVADAESHTTDFNYDWKGDLTVLGPEVNGNRPKTVTEHDDFGRVSAVTSWFGPGASDYNKMVKQYDHLGRITYQDTRDAADTIVTKQSFQYDAAGNMKVSTSYSDAAPTGAHTVCQYNALNQVVKITDPDNKETTIEYDYSKPDGINGLRTITTDAILNSITVDADAMGRSIQVVKRNAAGAVLHGTDSYYDAMGNVLLSAEQIYSQPDVCQRTVANAFAYNEVGQPIEITRSAGSDKARTKQLFYDPHGRLARTVLPNGIQLLRFYDEYSRLEHLQSNDGSVDYQYTYDLNGNLRTITDNVNGVDSEFTYDAMGNQVSEATFVDGHAIPVEYAYDLARRPTRTLVPGQNVIDYEYTVAGLHDVIRKSGVASIDATGGSVVYTHTYTDRDFSGHLLSATSDIGGTTSSSSYTYDVLGRRQTIAAPHWSHTVAATDGYDAVGNLLDYTVVDPVGTRSVSEGYSDLYQLTDHDESGSGAFSQAYSYDSIGNRLSGPALFDSASRDYAYNELNELTDASLAGNLSGQIVQVPVNGLVQPNPTTAASISSVTVQLDGALPVSATWSGEDWEVDGGTIDVPADGEDHVITVVATDTSGKQNTKTVTVNIDSAASNAYVYDLNGNLIQETLYLASGNVETTTYQYDALERLVFVVPPSGDSVEYRYDALHRRISKKLTQSGGAPASASEYYLWSGQSEIGTLVESGGSLALTQLRILGAGMGNEVGAAVAVELRANASSAWSVYEPVHDRRGNVVVMLNPNGSVAESYRYDAYGNEKIYNASDSEISDTQISNPWRFSSKRRDSETGLIYFGRRYYAPPLARFITIDPVGFGDGPNLYAYVGGNPMMYVDPDGRLAKEIGRLPIRVAADAWYHSGFSQVSHARNIDNPSQYNSILAFFDGTWNSPKDNTHIGNMHGRAPEDAYSLYHDGPGTSWFSRITGGFFGLGTLFRSELMYLAVNDAYSQIGTVPIFTAGFSRGATASADFLSLTYGRGLSTPAGGVDYNPDVTAVLIDRVGSLGIPGNRFDWMANMQLPDNANLKVGEARSTNESRLLFPVTLADRSNYQHTQFIGGASAAEFMGHHFDVGAKSTQSLAWAIGTANAQGFNLNAGNIDLSQTPPINDPLQGNWMYAWERYLVDPMYKFLTGSDMPRGVYWK